MLSSRSLFGTFRQLLPRGWYRVLTVPEIRVHLNQPHCVNELHNTRQQVDLNVSYNLSFLHYPLHTSGISLGKAVPHDSLKHIVNV